MRALVLVMKLKIAGKIALAARVITVVVIGVKVILLVANDGNRGTSDCDE